MTYLRNKDWHIKISLNTENDALTSHSDLDMETGIAYDFREVRRILRRVIENLARHDYQRECHHFLFDINGNAVGEFTVKEITDAE